MLFKLLGLPITLPASGIKFCLQQVLNAAEAELTDPAPVKEALLELQLRLEEGEITEDEYVEQEAILMRRLREIRAHRERMAQEQLARQAGHDQARLQSPTGAVIEFTADAPAGSSQFTDHGSQQPKPPSTVNREL